MWMKGEWNFAANRLNLIRNRNFVVDKGSPFISLCFPLHCFIRSFILDIHMYFKIFEPIFGLHLSHHMYLFISKGKWGFSIKYNVQQIYMEISHVGIGSFARSSQRFSYVPRQSDLVSVGMDSNLGRLYWGCITIMCILNDVGFPRDLSDPLGVYRLVYMYHVGCSELIG